MCVSYDRDHLPGYTVRTVRASLKTRHAETEESAESEGVIGSHKHREILSRRPSYRKILNELPSDVPGVPKIEEEKSEKEGMLPNIATWQYRLAYIRLAQGNTVCMLQFTMLQC